MDTGKTLRHAASVPFDAAHFLRADDLSGFIAEALADGDQRALPTALHTTTNVPGMAELVRRTGLSRKTLYRTLSGKGNPRLHACLDIASARKPQPRSVS